MHNCLVLQLQQAADRATQAMLSVACPFVASVHATQPIASHRRCNESLAVNLAMSPCQLRTITHGLLQFQLCWFATHLALQRIQICMCAAYHSSCLKEFRGTYLTMHAYNFDVRLWSVVSQSSCMPSSSYMCICLFCCTLQ